MIHIVRCTKRGRVYCELCGRHSAVYTMKAEYNRSLRTMSDRCIAVGARFVLRDFVSGVIMSMLVTGMTSLNIFAVLFKSYFL